MVTVKAYPAVSDAGDAICLAGVRLGLDSQPEWVRLFPVPFRDLPGDQQVAKYQMVRLRAKRTSLDLRPESLTPDLDSIEVGPVVKARRHWVERRRFVDPLVVPSMCQLLRLHDTSGTSLGLFPPGDVLAVDVEAHPAGWLPEKRGYLAQQTLFGREKAELQSVPYRFFYRYHCSERGCPTHRQVIVDWEIAEAWRGCEGSPEERMERVRHRWLAGLLCRSDRDTHFLVGNQHLDRETFMVLGVFYPPRRKGPTPPRPPGPTSMAASSSGETVTSPRRRLEARYRRRRLPARRVYEQDGEPDGPISLPS